MTQGVKKTVEDVVIPADLAALQLRAKQVQKQKKKMAPSALVAEGGLCPRKELVKRLYADDVIKPGQSPYFANGKELARKANEGYEPLVIGGKLVEVDGDPLCVIDSAIPAAKAKYASDLSYKNMQEKDTAAEKAGIIDDSGPTRKMFAEVVEKKDGDLNTE